MQKGSGLIDWDVTRTLYRRVYEAIAKAISQLDISDVHFSAGELEKASDLSRPTYLSFPHLHPPRLYFFHLSLLLIGIESIRVPHSCTSPIQMDLRSKR